MSLEAWGDDGLSPGEITAEDLYEAGLQSNEDGTLWWNDENKKMSFPDACEWLDSRRDESD